MLCIDPELIDWGIEQILKSNFTCNMIKKDLEKEIETLTEVPYFPLNTQSCERVIKQKSKY